MTIDYATVNLPGTKVINGFANQRPWDNGTEMLPDEFGFSRHYYTSYSDSSMIMRGNPNVNDEKYYLNALGKRDGEIAPSGATKPGTIFIPSHISAFPERWFYAYQTEFVTRDIQPFEGPSATHGRFASPGEGITAKVWMTEVNTYRWPWIEELMNKLSLDLYDPRLLPLSDSIAAKSTLRHYTFYASKGIEAIAIYATHDRYGFGVISEDFFDALKSNHYVLTDDIKAQVGPQLEAVKNVYNLMKNGKTIESPRNLKVEKIVEYKPRLVFKGDGTPEHPSRYHADDLAVLPYQLADNKFAIGYYVVTRDIRHSWNPSKELLDPNRYQMPEQDFDVTLSNVNGLNVTVSVVDPLTKLRIPVEIVSADQKTVTVKLKTVDYPRFLVMEEEQKGPLIQRPLLEKTSNGGVISFVPNVNGIVKVTWGPYPIREPSQFTQTRFADENFTNAIETQMIELINRNHKFSGKGSWEWRGLFSEKYRFSYDTDHSGTKVSLIDQLVIQGNGDPSGDIDLVSDTEYPIIIRYSSPYHVDHWLALYAMSQSENRNLVVVKTNVENRMVKNVTAEHRVYFPIEGLRQGDGVKIGFTSDGLTNTFPRWDYDVRSVMYASTPMQTEEPPTIDNILFIEFGMGIDLTGRKVTEAAVKAVQNAIQHTSIPGLLSMLPDHDFNHLKVNVRLAVPADKDKLDLTLVKNELLYSQVFFEVMDGGMLTASGNDLVYVVLAAIEYGF